MVEQFLHSVLSVSLAFLLLMTTTTVAFDAHFCQNRIEGISFFGKAKSCHEQTTPPPCEKTHHVCRKEMGMQDDDHCCHNETLIIKGLDSDMTVHLLPVEKQFLVAFVATFVVPDFFSDFISTSNPSDFPRYKPPLIRRDIPVLYQTFLI